MEEIGLKPCPFCGSGPTWLSIEMVSAPDYVSAEPSVFVVICGNCHAWGPQASTKKKATEAWNTRAGA